MKITVMTAGEQILNLDVDPHETVENVKALLEVETRVLLQQQQLLYNGREMRNSEKLSALGVKDEDLIMMVSNAAPSASANALSFNPDGSAVNPGAFQQHIKNDSNLIAQLFQSDPDLAQVILGNDLNRLQELLRQRHRQKSELRRQQDEELALLYADPFDVEAQKKIEAAIRQKGIDENWAAALEHNPEAFARVVMLYVDMEVNGVPLKAFVDSGAQSTIISKSCAERCGLLRLLDQRYKGIAHGVGQSEILGRIHVAPIKIGNIFYPCSFLVLDAPNMEFLFGLDMLRKHQCIIDLKDSVLRVGGGEVSVPFLQDTKVLPVASKVSSRSLPNLETTIRSISLNLFHKMVKNNNVASGSRVPAVWNNQNTAIFCDMCVKEVEAGNRPGTHFKKEGWENVRISLSKETGAEYDKSQLKNKWDALKEQWKIWKELIGKETGLGWNSKLGTIDASDEWWHNKIEINPKYAKLRRKGISPDMEEKFDRMFMNTTATGDHAWAPSSGVLPTHDSSECDGILLDSGDDSDDPVYVPDETIQVTEKSYGKWKKRTNQQLDTQVKKEKNRNRVATKVGKVGGAVKLSQQIERMVDVMENRNTTSVMMKGSQGSSIAEVMKVVSSLPGAGPGSHLWLFATRLFLNQEKREMFTTMEDPNIKLQWLNYELSEK